MYKHAHSRILCVVYMYIYMYIYTLYIYIYIYVLIYTLCICIYMHYIYVHMPQCAPPIHTSVFRSMSSKKKRGKKIVLPPAGTALMRLCARTVYLHMYVYLYIDKPIYTCTYACAHAYMKSFPRRRTHFMRERLILSGNTLFYKVTHSLENTFCQAAHSMRLHKAALPRPLQCSFSFSLLFFPLTHNR